MLSAKKDDADDDAHHDGTLFPTFFSKSTHMCQISNKKKRNSNWFSQLAYLLPGLEAEPVPYLPIQKVRTRSILAGYWEAGANKRKILFIDPSGPPLEGHNRTLLFLLTANKVNGIPERRNHPPIDDGEANRA